MQVIERLAWIVFFISSVLLFGVALYAFTLGILLNRRADREEADAGRRAVEAGGTSQLAASSATLLQATQTAQAKRAARSAG